VTDRDATNIDGNCPADVSRSHVSVDPAATESDGVTDLELTVDPPGAESDTALSSTNHELAVDPAAAESRMPSSAHTASEGVMSANHSPSFKDLIAIPEKLRPHVQSTRKRRVGHACLITGSPHKRMLIELKQQKIAAQEKSTAKKVKAAQKKAEKDLKQSQLKCSSEIMQQEDSFEEDKSNTNETVTA